MSSGEPAVKTRRAFVSAVIPVYNEQDNVLPMHRALTEMAGAQGDVDFEFLFVDDGSTDRTFESLEEINRRDPRAKIIRLSRNYGAHSAVAAGLQLCSGDAAVLLSVDLQDHPREIPRFIEKWREGYQVIWGVRASRQDAPLDALLSRIFGAIIRRVALRNYPRTGTGSFCLIDRLVIDAYNAFPERNRVNAGLILYAGFRQTQIPFERHARQAGRSKWSFDKKVKIAIDMIVSFSTVPIRLTSIAGICIAFFSFIYAGVIVVDHYLYSTQLLGWASIIVMISMLGGLQLFVLGMLGEYLWRALDDVRRRPMFFVAEMVGDFQRPRLASSDASGRFRLPLPSGVGPGDASDRGS